MTSYIFLCALHYTYDDVTASFTAFQVKYMENTTSSAVTPCVRQQEENHNLNESSYKDAETSQLLRSHVFPEIQVGFIVFILIKINNIKIVVTYLDGFVVKFACDGRYVDCYNFFTPFEDHRFNRLQI